MNSINQYKDKVLVVKFGGALAEDDKIVENIAEQVLYLHQNVTQKIVVVHGGGRQIDIALEKAGVKIVKENGRRVTSAQTLSVMGPAIAGLNEHIAKIFNGVAGLDHFAIGVAGHHGKCAMARSVDPSCGSDGHLLNYTGEMVGFDSRPIERIWKSGDIPLFYSLCFNQMALGSGGAFLSDFRLNVNADDMAADMAMSLDAARLIICSDQDGVLDQAGHLIAEVSIDEVEELISSGVVTGGMIPKLRKLAEAAGHLGHGGVALVNGLKHGAIVDELLSQSGSGTLIKASGPMVAV